MTRMNHPRRPLSCRQIILWFVTAIMGLWSTLGMTSNQLSLAEAIQQAIRLDPVLLMTQWDQTALESEADAAGQWQDPALLLEMANLPRDTFDLDQEPMTQIRVGLMQTLPRGQSLPLRRQALMQQATAEQWRGQLRRADIRRAVTLEWLDAWQAGQSLRLINSDRELFQYLVEVVTAQYSSSLADARQQDLIRAELELIRLDDRLTDLAMQQQRALARLSARVWDSAQSVSHIELADRDDEKHLEAALNALPDGFLNSDGIDEAILAEWLMDHPALNVLDQSIAIRETEVDLVRQQYRPQWTLRATYGYREDDRNGLDRPDFLSVGATLDLPLFPSRRQDRRRDAAQARLGSSETRRWQQLRTMLGELSAHREHLKGLMSRRALYQQRLLTEIEQQASASLNAYTHDDGDFSEVVRARIDALNAGIDALNIDASILKSLAQIAYFLPAVMATESVEGS